MSLPDINKSGTDVSSNSSWSVIEESEDSRKASLQDVVIHPDTEKINGSDEENRASDIENSFITIPEDAAWTVDPSDHVPPPRKSKKRRTKKAYAEPLSIVTIIASILTITGITLLCMLFPQDIDTQSYDQLHRAYIDVVTKADENIPEVINKTSEALKVVQEAQLLNKIHQRLECDDGGECSCNEEDTCPADQEASDSDTYHDGFEPLPGMRFPVRIPSEIPNTGRDNVEPPDTLTALQNTTFSLLSKLKETVISDPHFHILLCTVMQDLCLIKLVKQLNSKHSALIKKVKSNTASTSGKKEKKGSLTKKTMSKVPSRKNKKHLNFSEINEEASKSKVASHPKKLKKMNNTTKAKNDTSNLKAVLLPTSGKNEVNTSGTKKGTIARQTPVPDKQTTDLTVPQISKIEMALVSSAANMKADRLKAVPQTTSPSIKDVSKKAVPPKKSSFDFIDLMSNRNDSQQKIEELRKKWESAGNDHRQRIQLIKAEFKDEVLQAREAGIGASQRAQKIKIIRDKYVARLKMDRERYLAQLRRFREDKQRLIDDICLRVKQNTNQKDASVGNYAVLFDDYDFRQTLKNLSCNQSSSRNFYMDNLELMSKKDTAENLAKYQSGDDMPLETDIEDISSRGSSQSLNLTASFSSKIHDRPKIKYTSLSKNASEANNGKLGQVVEYPSVEEVVGNMMSNLSKLSASFSNLNERVNKSKLHPGFNGDRRIKSPIKSTEEGNIHDRFGHDWMKIKAPIERMEEGRNNDSFEHEEKRVKVPIEKMEENRQNNRDSFGNDNISIKTPIEGMEEDRGNNDSFGDETTKFHKEDETSGEETEEENFPRDPLSAKDTENQFKVVIRRKGRKRDIYEAAFDENGQKIKEKDMMKWGLERRMRSPQPYALSKQDPKRTVKEKFSFKGQL